MRTSSTYLSIQAHLITLITTTLKQSCHLSEAKTAGNPTAILHDEEFQLAARAFVHGNAYRKGEPNLTTDGFCKWVNDSFGVVIAHETGRQWLHHLGFSIYNHPKGVFF